jgi:hypothetical protein
MKKQTLVLVILILTLAASVHAQLGKVSTPSLTGAMAKLFGDNTAYTADVEFQLNGTQPTSLPGKMSFDSGKSRFEMNLAEAKGGQTPHAADQMKAMGMDKMMFISRPDTKVVYVVFPSLSGYTETPLKDPDADKPDSAYKVQLTELARETVDGHVCVKNKAVVTDDQGKTHESTVWNAIDLKNFPLKIETTEQGRSTTMLFKNVNLTKPDAALFDPPADCKKYDSQQALMQQAIMKHMGNMTMPPGHP